MPSYRIIIRLKLENIKTAHSNAQKVVLTIIINVDIFMMTIIVILNYFESIVHMFLSLSLYFLNTFYLKQIDYVDSTFKVRTGTRRYKDDATQLSKDLHSVQKSHTQKGSPLGLMLCWHHLENVNDFVFEHLFCKV